MMEETLGDLVASDEFAIDCHRLEEMRRIRTQKLFDKYEKYCNVDDDNTPIIDLDTMEVINDNGFFANCEHPCIFGSTHLFNPDLMGYYGNKVKTPVRSRQHYNHGNSTTIYSSDPDGSYTKMQNNTPTHLLKNILNNPNESTLFKVLTQYNITMLSMNVASDSEATAYDADSEPTMQKYEEDGQEQVSRILNMEALVDDTVPYDMKEELYCTHEDDSSLSCIDIEPYDPPRQTDWSYDCISIDESNEDSVDMEEINEDSRPSNILSLPRATFCVNKWSWFNDIQTYDTKPCISLSRQSQDESSLVLSNCKLVEKKPKINVDQTFNVFSMKSSSESDDAVILLDDFDQLERKSYTNEMDTTSRSHTISVPYSAKVDEDTRVKYKMIISPVSEASTRIECQHYYSEKSLVNIKDTFKFWEEDDVHQPLKRRKLSNQMRDILTLEKSKRHIYGSEHRSTSQIIFATPVVSLKRLNSDEPTQLFKKIKLDEN